MCCIHIVAWLVRSLAGDLGIEFWFDSSAHQPINVIANYRAECPLGVVDLQRKVLYKNILHRRYILAELTEFFL